MIAVKLLGQIMKFGASRKAGGEKEKVILFAVHGSIENLDFLMDKPLSITIEILQETIGAKA